MSDNVTLPRELTAENGAKGLLIGEFKETIEVRNPEYICDDCSTQDEQCKNCEHYGDPEYVIQDVPVSWTTIKDIYKIIVGNLTKTEGNKEEMAARVYELESVIKKYIKDYKSTDKRKISYIAGYYCDEFKELMK